MSNSQKQRSRVLLEAAQSVKYHCFPGRLHWIGHKRNNWRGGCIKGPLKQPLFISWPYLHAVSLVLLCFLRQLIRICIVTVRLFSSETFCWSLEHRRMCASALTWTHYPRRATALMAISIPTTPPCEYSIRHDGQNNRLDLASDRIRAPQR